MIYLLIGVGVTLWLVIIFLSLENLAAKQTMSSSVPILIVCALSVSGIAYLVDKRSSENPCVKYEQKLTYNPATKTMIPARVCVERGEWVTESEEN